MNFNEYPLKVELSDGLHVYERKTGKSAHMLIEQLITEFLIKEGYLNIAIENLVKYPKKLLDIEENIEDGDDREETNALVGDNSIKQTGIQEESVQKGFVETDYVDKNKFKVVKVSQKSCKLLYDSLVFGQHPSEMIEDLIDKLSMYPLSKMKFLSKEHLESKYSIPLGRYPKVLRKIVDNPSEDVEIIIVNCFVSHKKKHDGFDLRILSTYAGYFSKEEVDEFEKHFSKLNVPAVYELRDLIKNVPSKKKEVVMEFVKSYDKT